MTEAEERLARAQANDADWDARQSQQFDPARAQQAALDALATIDANQAVFLQMRAFHREASHPGNPDAAQRAWSENWLLATDKALAIALKVRERVEAEAIQPGPEEDPA